MTETRIRWDETRTGTLGYVGTMTAPAFRIRWIVSDEHGWTLTTYLPLMIHGKRDRADDPDELKAEAERWLAGFVSSLGAVFPDEPDESAAFQLSEARDVLARWDAEPGGAIMFGRERVLADQVRVLLAIVASEPVPPHPEEEN